MLLIAKRSARDTRIKCLNQIRHLGFTGPDELRERLRGVPRGRLAGTAAGLRPTAGSDPVVYATKLALQTLGRRVVDLETTTQRLDATLDQLVCATAPNLVAVAGVGIDTAAILLVAAGDNPERTRPSPRRPARPTGIDSTRAATAKPTTRCGIVFTRMSSDERTRKYVARRLGEGRTTKEIMRILKRYVAREIYKHLPRD